MKWLSDNIKYPAEAAKNGIEGRVIVQFVIGSDGTVSDAVVRRSVDPLLDAEALRVINAMPAWTPGKQDGKPVAVRYTIPVTFRSDKGVAKGKGGVIELKGENYVPDNARSVTVESNLYYVVDGKPVDDISNIKANDIESMTIYKDAKHTTDKYGDAAKNGVVEITTRKK